LSNGCAKRVWRDKPLKLYGGHDFAALPLPDLLHSDGAAHRRTDERFAAPVFNRASNGR
jgi:hypothetical protein